MGGAAAEPSQRDKQRRRDYLPTCATSISRTIASLSPNLRPTRTCNSNLHRIHHTPPSQLASTTGLRALFFLLLPHYDTQNRANLVSDQNSPLAPVARTRNLPESNARRHTTQQCPAASSPARSPAPPACPSAPPAPFRPPPPCATPPPLLCLPGNPSVPSVEGECPPSPRLAELRRVRLQLPYVMAARGAQLASRTGRSRRRRHTALLSTGDG